MNKIVSLRGMRTTLAYIHHSSSPFLVLDMRFGSFSSFCCNWREKTGNLLRDDAARNRTLSKFTLTRDGMFNQLRKTYARENR